MPSERVPHALHRACWTSRYLEELTESRVLLALRVDRCEARLLVGRVHLRHSRGLSPYNHDERANHRQRERESRRLSARTLYILKYGDMVVKAGPIEISGVGCSVPFGKTLSFIT
mgnify:CR=1 FL=1